jgi:hypothetical protein
MANLWRALALSWLGGIASPMLTGDVFAGELLRPMPALSRGAETDISLDLIEVALREDEDSPQARVTSSDDG